MAQLKSGSTAGGYTILTNAANTVDSTQYVDGSIDRVHLAADIIDGTKIANDVINSEHYAAGSIDAEHLATGSVTSVKCATNINGYGTRTVSTAAASGGSDGDVWYKY